MINSNPTEQRAHRCSVPPSACCAYKAIFPMITPTMKNKTTRARSRVLRPSSFPAEADPGAGLWLCAAFLIRSPSSSYGSKRTFQRQPKAPAAEVNCTVQQGRGALKHRPGAHAVVQPPHLSKRETKSHREGGAGLRPLRNASSRPLFSSLRLHEAARHLFTPHV